MKKNVVGLVVCLLMISSVSYSQDIRSTVQPGCFYRMSDKDLSNPADSLFNWNADTSWKPTYDNGNRAICKGVWVAWDSDTGFIVVHPLYNSDTTRRYPIKIGYSDLGQCIPFLFDKIFYNGTTVNTDSIGYLPDLGAK